MGILSKLLGKESRNCFVCQKPLDKNFSEVQFMHKDGIGKAFFCSECSDEMEKSQNDQEDKDDLPV